jgi:hypothetical protein
MVEAQISEVDAISAPFSLAHQWIGKHYWVREKPVRFVSMIASQTIFS